MIIPGTLADEDIAYLQATDPWNTLSSLLGVRYTDPATGTRTISPPMEPHDADQAARDMNETLDPILAPAGIATSEQQWRRLEALRSRPEAPDLPQEPPRGAHNTWNSWRSRESLAVDLVDCVNNSHQGPYLCRHLASRLEGEFRYRWRRLRDNHDGRAASEWESDLTAHVALLCEAARRVYDPEHTDPAETKARATTVRARLRNASAKGIKRTTEVDRAPKSTSPAERTPRRTLAQDIADKDRRNRLARESGRGFCVRGFER